MEHQFMDKKVDSLHQAEKIIKKTLSQQEKKKK